MSAVQPHSPTPTWSSAFFVDLISRYLFALLPVPIYLCCPSAVDLEKEWFGFIRKRRCLHLDDNSVVPVCTSVSSIREPSLSVLEGSCANHDPPIKILQVLSLLAWEQGFNFGRNAEVLIASEFLAQHVGSNSKLFGFPSDCFTRLKYWAELFYGIGQKCLGWNPRSRFPACSLRPSLLLQQHMDMLIE